MKKTLLTLALAFAGFSANSQVIFSVEEPSSIDGAYEFTYATNDNSWNIVDLTNPANAVLDTVKLALDTSPTADSLMCLAAPAGSLAGKIALLYRGSCDFGLKAKNAQDAGAVAIIVVNNADDVAINMLGGTNGLLVTIPTIIVSSSTGALIKEQIENGVVVRAFIGTKTGLHAVDLKTSFKHVMVTEMKSIPLSLAQSSTEFPVKLGVFVLNDGSALQSGITVKAEVKKGATSLYTETSAAFAMPSLTDSVWVDGFPEVSIPSYSVGEYTITYTIIPTAADGYPADNVITTKFNITDDIFSLARLDDENKPTIDGGSRPATPDGSFTNCIVFRNANASRLGAEGIYFGILKNAADGAITGEEITLQAFRWNDQFDNLDDAAFAFDNMEEVASASYTYPADYQDSIIYQPFTTSFVFEDDQRYLFCVKTFTEEVFLAYDTQTKYAQLDVIDPQPRGPIQIGTDWGIGFTGSPVPAIGVKTFVNTSSIAENKLADATVFPNPAKENVTVSIKGFTGDAYMTVTDVAGKTVINRTITTDANGNVKVNTSELNNGMYIFNLELKDGTAAKFNVVINK